MRFVTIIGSNIGIVIAVSIFLFIVSLVLLLTLCIYWLTKN